MRQIRLIADDLTGALDSSCAFASEREPMLIGLPWRQLPNGHKLAVSTESRDETERTAVEYAKAAVNKLKAATTADTIWFKKVDSVLRGHAIAETEAVYRAGDFTHCVFAPAYPDMGRITVGACQFAVTPNGMRSRVGPDFVNAFRQFGLTASTLVFDENDTLDALPSPSPSVMLIDAENQQLLASRIEGLSKRIANAPTLWSGAGGLAAALGSTSLSIRFPPVRCFIIGTNHTSTVAQVKVLGDLGLVAELRLGIGILDPQPTKPVLIAPALAAADSAEVSARIYGSVQAMEFDDPLNTSVVVTGGATLSIVLQAIDAEYLECLGDAVTGVPVSRVRGGRWDGVTLLSKSGGFGAPEIFAQIMQRTRM